MSWRYIYIASVVVLSYVLFLSWNAEKEIKQEVAEATAININNNERILPAGETEDFIDFAEFLRSHNLVDENEKNKPNKNARF